MRFFKGHGTENDFIILPDPEGEAGVSAALVARICDRRAGIGADGVLVVTRTKESREVGHHAAAAEWFMDYRNSDGGVAEMCGNGVRVFARYLIDAGLEQAGEFGVATRGGVRTVRVEPNGDITVDMGKPVVHGESVAIVGGQEYTGLHVDMGNPHLACAIGDPVVQLDLTHQPGFDTGVFPAGVNIELFNPVGTRRAVMRVYERGSGETRSCGTGSVATAVAAAALSGETTGTWTVEVLGGTLTVILEEETSYLSGPAVIVASGELMLAE
ncbi:diaminopimelate epimerase [Nonomuraea phyllanthi]|uniref:Diaminopimelate epimerase n=1 Tax=Nonomuraea phyllanthi TaxID=2219224 RepID=A0A5C4WQB1_9ACTN|nr:diaminopimelate epimerase [Nonomuraea phyllanthi]KAB8195716.1 diaminopimelate epimerase [Nonomuraea phyllanthi]QFY07158.1 diaminopimelate epimerase [Nonomuraea phyllanthi]